MRSPNKTRERAFSAPPIAVAIALSLPTAYLLQSLGGPDFQNAIMRRFALVPAEFWRGRWETTLTSLWLHGSWMHALVNAVFTLALATPVARLLGPGARGVFAFLFFYLACGVAAGVGYAVVHPDLIVPVVGASGAGAGLFAAAGRLMAGAGRVGPLLSRPVIGLTTAMVVVNGVFGAIGANLGGEPGTSVAWEAHLFGYAAGLFLIGPVASIFGERGEGPLKNEARPADIEPPGRPLGPWDSHAR